MARAVVIVLGLTSLVSTGAAVHFWKALQVERLRVAAVADAASLDSPSAPLESPPPSGSTSEVPIAVPAAALAAPPPVPVVPPKAQPTTGPSAKPGAAAVPEPLRQLQERIADPAAREVMLRQHTAAMRATMPDLGAFMGLGEAGVDRLLTVFADDRLRQMERRFTDGGTAASPNVNPNGAAEGRRSLEEAIAQEFGADVASRWREYQESLPARTVVRNLQLGFLDADVPLSRDQRQQLVDTYRRAWMDTAALRPMAISGTALAAAGAVVSSSTSPEHAADFRLNMLEQVQARNDRIREESQAYLTSTQQAVLEKQLRSEMEMQRLAIEMAKTMSPAVVRSPANGGN